MPIGFLYGLTSGIFFGLMGYLVHACTGKLPSAQVAFFRSLFTCLALAPWAALHYRSAVTRKSLSLWTRSVAGGVSALCYFWNLQASNVGIATAFSNLSHVFVALLGWRLFRIRISPLQLGGIGLAVCGALTLSGGAAAPPVAVIAIGATGALTASVAYLALREAAQVFSTGLVVWAFGFAGVVASLAAPGTHWMPVGSLGVDTSLAAHVLGIGAAGLAGQFLMTRSFLYLPAHVASVLALSSLVWGVMLEMWLDGRRPPLSEWASYSLVVLGIAVLRIAASHSADAGEAVASQ